MAKLFSHAATILAVKDMQISIAYYCNQLGFDLTFTWGEPVEYAVLNREEAVSIHLSKSSQDIGSGNHTALYIFVHDVDRVYEEFQSKEVTITTPIGDRDYYMRDFDLKDPDGHIITIGKGVSE